MSRGGLVLMLRADGRVRLPQHPHRRLCCGHCLFAVLLWTCVPQVDSQEGGRGHEAVLRVALHRGSLRAAGKASPSPAAIFSSTTPLLLHSLLWLTSSP